MKILFDHNFPFSLAHGGLQTQIVCTMEALETIGLSVRPLGWWDDSQSGDIIHYFGRPTGVYVRAAQAQGFRVVVTELLSGLGARSAIARLFQKASIAMAQRIGPEGVRARMGWDSYRMADALVALTPWEAQLMRSMFSAPPDRVHCVPNGVEKIFLESVPLARQPWLLCTSTIRDLKRTLELAEAAVLADTPIRIIGKPFSENDPYAVRFSEFVEEHSSVVRYEGAINDRAQLATAYREARGFVLLSAYESLSLSALEAAACECPLLLSDLPWARSAFADTVSYCPLASSRRTAPVLRQFYDRAPDLKAPPRPPTWTDVGTQLKAIYESTLTNPR